MRISETFRSSYTALLSNKTRSFLTMLGVIIGVFSVVALVSVVSGVQSFVVDQFNAIGSNLIIVAPGRASFDTDPAVAFTNNKLDIKHKELVEKYAGDRLTAVTVSLRVGKNVKRKTNKYYTGIMGTTYEALNVIDFEIDKGRFFTKAEQNSNAKVIVIGDLIKKELFNSTNPIGETMKIDSSSFEVIGTLKKEGSRADERVFVPFTTLKDIFDIENISSITTRAKNTDEIDIAIKEIEAALLRDLNKDDFTVISQKDILKSVGDITQILSLGLTLVSGISLIVGGIGIMNIMFVSVTERTREIGLRKALGATSFDIGSQFLLEALSISIMGGILGLALAWGATFAGKQYINASVPIWAVGLAVGFSLFVGITFGTYPALQASKKDPITALRYE